MSSFELSSPLKTSTTSAPGHGFKFSHLGSIQVNKRPACHLSPFSPFYCFSLLTSSFIPPIPTPQPTQVRYTKREMRRMYKNLIKYPEHQQPKRFIEPGTHPSWEQRFKVNLVNGVPTVLNRRPGFSHNLYSVSNNQHRWARKWVPTPDWYVTKMKKLGLRISTAYKQKTERPRPYVPS